MKFNDHDVYVEILHFGCIWTQIL